MAKNFQIEEKDRKQVKTVTIIGIISICLNVTLGISKIIIGKIISSSSLFSDGIHSTGDVLTTIIAMLSVYIAARKRNIKYNYGYERWASIASLTLSIILFLVSFDIIIESTTSLVDLIKNPSSTLSVSSPLWLISLILSSSSVFLKIIMFFATFFAAKKAKSTAMKLDAFHQLIDALSSIAAIISLLGYYIFKDKSNILDPIFSYPISLMIISIAFESFKKATKELTDHAVEDSKIKSIKKILFNYIDENQIKNLKTRIFSEKFYIDLTILLDPSLTLEETDNLIDKIKNEFFKSFDDLKDVNINVLPNNTEHINQEELIR